MDNLPEATRKNIIDDLNIKFKSMFIDMDLKMHQNLNSPRVRKLQKSIDSHEEFEFSMSNMAMKDDVYEPAMEVASADKLFFRGQLLPLQQDPKLHLVQALTCPKDEACCDKEAPFAKHYANLLNLQFPLNKLEEPHAKCPSEKGLLMMCDNDESSPMQCISQAASNPSKYHAHEEGFALEFSLRDGFDPMRSCRLDSVFDLFKSDSRSSSFRSHQSSYWSSGEKDSRNSSSSSRCSNGSYQDSSCLQGADRKTPQISMLKAKYANANVSAENECEMGVINRDADPNLRSIHGSNPPIPTVNLRKWSWKGLFAGLRKASKLWADGERGEEGGQVPSKEDVQKKAVFTFKELPCALGEPVSYRRSVGHDWEWQANTYQFVSNEGSSKTGKLRDDDEEQQISTVFCLRSGGRQEASFNGGSAGDCEKREKGKVQGNTWNAKESWNRCVNKVKKGTRLSTARSKGQQKLLSPMQMNNNSNAMLMSELEDKRDVYRVMKAKSLSSTPLAKSPVRMPSEYNGSNPSNGGYGGLYSTQGSASIAISSSSSSSMKNMSKKVGFASCPASMRSSPHHSGLLAVINKATPDLHAAIQGAIAHCKQSQASNPP